MLSKSYFLLVFLVYFWIFSFQKVSVALREGFWSIIQHDDWKKDFVRCKILAQLTEKKKNLNKKKKENLFKFQCCNTQKPSNLSFLSLYHLHWTPLLPSKLNSAVMQVGFLSFVVSFYVVSPQFDEQMIIVGSCSLLSLCVIYFFHLQCTSCFYLFIYFLLLAILSILYRFHSALIIE